MVRDGYGGRRLLATGLDFRPVRFYAQGLSIKAAKEITTSCPYCAVGGGQIVHTDKASRQIINTEGDADHPINEGAPCAKGAVLYQLAVNPARVSPTCSNAPPNSDKWEARSWDWGLDRIAANIKRDRNASFTLKNDKGQEVNRTTAIAHVGSAALGNIDLSNSDYILIMSSNAAENHPISFKWATKAQEKSATFIHVDSCLTRTSTKADIYAPCAPARTSPSWAA